MNISNTGLLLHDHLSSTSQTERLALKKEIEHEWQIGTCTLPPSYHSLFQGTLENLSYHNKRLWLASNSLIGKGNTESTLPNQRSISSKR